MQLDRDFFLRSPNLVARDLLGFTLTTSIRARNTSGTIVEVEAYGAKDEASHSFRGQTARNKVMFGPAGFCYVYFTYGMHFCVNVVTEAKGIGSAVLIRAVAPLEGIELMAKRRATNDPRNFASGPGKLCQAFGITQNFNGHDMLTSSRIFLSSGLSLRDDEITYSERIGISKAKERPWRIYVTNSKFVSKAQRKKE